MTIPPYKYLHLSRNIGKIFDLSQCGGTCWIHQPFNLYIHISNIYILERLCRSFLTQTSIEKLILAFIIMIWQRWISASWSPKICDLADCNGFKIILQLVLCLVYSIQVYLRDSTTLSMWLDKPIQAHSIPQVCWKMSAAMRKPRTKTYGERAVNKCSP